MSLSRGWLIVALMSLLSAAVGHQADANILDGGIEQYDSNVDYFPHKVHVQHASGFTVSYHRHFKVVTVLNPWRDADQTFQYVLVQRGAPAPEGYPKAQHIEVPVRTMVTLSPTYLAHVDQLGIADRLVGHSDLKQVHTPAIVKRIEAGQLVEVGRGASVNVELLLDLQPELIMTHGSGNPQRSAHPKLLEVGLKVAFNAEYMDTSPLGQTEWVKFIAVFFNREAAAERLFPNIVAAYDRLVERTRQIRNKPTVFSQASYQGAWFMPGGNSFMARFIKDAGGTYLWADDNSTGSLRLDFEAVFERASEADVWLLKWPGWERVSDVLTADERNAKFLALNTGRIYNNNARLNAHGGNDYWETGMAKPHLVLADLVKIFHPDLVPDHELIWYRPLKRE